MNSKRKGSTGERELLDYLKAHGLEAERHDQRYTGGQGNPDIGVPGFHIECKRTESFRPYDALWQAVHDAVPETVPIVCHRRNRGEWTVFMRLEDFINNGGFRNRG